MGGVSASHLHFTNTLMLNLQLQGKTNRIEVFEEEAV